MARPLNKEHIEKLATEVRKSIVKKFDFAKNLDARCAVASFVLWRFLNKFKYKTKLVKGKFTTIPDCPHCWVIVGDTLIVDITASQFSSKEKKFHDVEIVPKDCPTYVSEIVEHDVLQDFANWPDDQKPSTYRKDINELIKKLYKKCAEKEKQIKEVVE